VRLFLWGVCAGDPSVSKQALSGASFTSPHQLREAIAEFVAVYNKTAAPFKWAKALVHPTAPKHSQGLRP